MANDFLHKEYELCFEQLRFYDTRQTSLLKFMFSLTSAVATAIFGIQSAYPDNQPAALGAVLFVGTIVLVSSLLLFLAMLQNRLYFVFTARQLNAIRGHCLKNEASDFVENQLYTKTDFSAVKLMSCQTLTIAGAAFLIAAYAGALTVAITYSFTDNVNQFVAIAVFALTLVTLIVLGYKYLRTYGAKSADHAIHGAPTK